MSTLNRDWELKIIQQELDSVGYLDLFKYFDLSGDDIEFTSSLSQWYDLETQAFARDREVFEQGYREMINFFDSLNIVYQVRQIIEGYPVQFYIPSTKVAVIYESMERQSSYPFDYNHLRSKTLMDHGIRPILFHVFEWMNIYKRDILTSILTHACGKTSKKYFARKLVVKSIPNRELREACTKWSPHGFRSAAVNLGLYTKDTNELVYLQTFGNAFYSRAKYDCEIIRQTSKLFTNTPGGSSKLFSHFIKNFDYIEYSSGLRKVNNVVVYVDTDHFGGVQTYKEEDGWKTLGWTCPVGFRNYWVISGRVANRQPNYHQSIMRLQRFGFIRPLTNVGTITHLFER